MGERCHAPAGPTGRVSGRQIPLFSPLIRAWSDRCPPRRHKCLPTRVGPPSTITGAGPKPVAGATLQRSRGLSASIRALPNRVALTPERPTGATPRGIARSSRSAARAGNGRWSRRGVPSVAWTSEIGAPRSRAWLAWAWRTQWGASPGRRPGARPPLTTRWSCGGSRCPPFASGTRGRTRPALAAQCGQLAPDGRPATARRPRLRALA